MGRRDDFYRVMNHQQPERLVIDFGGCPQTSMDGKSHAMLLDYLGYGPVADEERLPFGRARKIDERVLELFDTDTRSVGTILRPRESLYREISENEYIDEWGIRRVFTGLYWDIVDYPLKGAAVRDLKNYRFPDPRSVDPQEIERYASEARRLFEETDYIVCAEHPVYGVFELGCWLCSFDDFLLKMALDEEFVNMLFEIILEYQKQVIDVYYGALGRHIHYTSSGDDFATQSSLFVSPEMFRALVKPYLKERISYTKQYTDAAYLHHSCGSVFPIVDDLIDCGVEILNPIQPKAKNMDPAALKEAYGDRIVFHGGIDTQEILPFGTRDEIESCVRDTISVLNSDGGYIFAAAHNIQEDVPPENLAFMLETARRQAPSGWTEGRDRGIKK
ncbi:MAG: methyltransferase [Clostridiales bacterium]|nr:methyltransferase [Clostridiales bacterium]